MDKDLKLIDLLEYLSSKYEFKVNIQFTKNTYNRHNIIILDISSLSKHFFAQKTQYIPPNHAHIVYILLCLPQILSNTAKSTPEGVLFYM